MLSPLKSRILERFSPHRFFISGPYTHSPGWGFSTSLTLLFFTALLGLIWMSPDARSTSAGDSLVTKSSPTTLIPATLKNDPDGRVAQVANGDWQAQFGQQLADFEYIPSETPRGLQAPNRVHNLRTYFDAEGIRVHDRSDVGSPLLVDMSLARLGRGDVLVPVKSGSVRQRKNRVEIHRPGLIEWYENSAQGLEQGFTLPQRLQGKGSLVLELAVEHADASLTGQSVELHTDEGRRLRYGKLKVVDANGRILFSRFAVPSPDRVHLVVNDAAATYPLLIDPLLTAVADAFLESNDPDPGSFDAAVFGGTVASAGDVNGDGFGDVIVGARGWDNGLFDEGAAFVFLGSATGIVGFDPATAHAVILSDQASSEFGVSVAGAGDVNGDGFDDIIVGANLYEGILPGTNLEVTGAAFVFHGGPSGILATSPVMADAFIEANQIGAFLGFSVAEAGDVNADGFGDIIVGVPRQGSPTFPPNIPPNQGQGTGGAALVFHGSALGITGTSFSDADAVLLPYPAGFPEPSGTLMGADVSGAGDVNGDGFDDILVNANGTVVFLGSATGIVGTDPTTAHAHISGAGTVVSAAGNVNGDLFGDIIIGNPGFPNITPGLPLSQSGSFGVFLGSAAGITATSFNQAQTLVQGTIENQQLGRKVAGAGDIDNDGFGDIIVGAVGYAGSLNSEGAAYVFRGGPSGIVANTLLDAYVRLESGQSEAVRRLNRTEVDVDGLGDVNGDGFADVILGVGFYDAGELNEGGAFVYHGGVAPLTPNQAPVADAGADQVFTDFDNSGTATVTADGSLSSDPDGSIVSFGWFEGETLLGTDPVLTTALSATGNHTLVLEVTDDAGLSRGDPVVFRVEGVNSEQLFFDDFLIGFGAWVTGGDVQLSSADAFPTPPQIRIGASGAFLRRSIALPAGSTGMTLRYWGKASQFAAADELLVKVSVDGAPFTIIQTITSASSDDTYVFYGGSAIPVGFSWFPATASNIVLEFESNMTTGLFFVDDIIVNALQAPPGSQQPPAGELPVVNAGADTAVNDNDNDGFELVTLDGTLSSDPDGFIVSHQWFEVTPMGSSLLGSGATLGASFGIGSHTVQLIVTDNDGGSASDIVMVTVNQALANNLAPIANAGLDMTIVDTDGDTLEFVRFDGRASSDPDGTIVSYIWTENGNQINNAAVFVITMPIGVHTVELTVTDNQGATSTDTVVMTVQAATTAPPVVNSFLAAPAIITEGEPITLSWATTGATSVTIDNGVGTVAVDGSNLVSPLANTTYTLTATGAGGTVTSSVTVTVNPAPTPTPPVINSFQATQTTITVGESTTLSWTTTAASSVAISGVGASFPADGNTTVSPLATTTYTLSATGAGGTTTASITVTVNAASTEIVSISQLEFRADKNEWRIEGSSTIPGPGNSITIYIGPNAPGAVVLGTAAVDSSGFWEFRERGVAAELDNTGTISIQSSQGGILEGIFVVPPVPGADPLPSINSFSAAPVTIAEGEAAILSWTTTDATSVSINNGVGAVAVDGNTSVSPLATTTYTLTATGAGGTQSASTTVTVNPAPTLPPTVDGFAAAPATITAGASTTLSWTTTDASSVAINGVGTGLPADGSVSVSPTITTTYTLTATGAGGTANASTTVTVNPAPTLPPAVDSFAAAPATITAGASTTLSWTTTDATSVLINNGVGAVAVDGNTPVSPLATTTYTLTATGAGGTQSASTTVTVNPAPTLPPAVDSFAAAPATITAGASTTLSWTTTDATSVSIDNGIGTVAVDGSTAVSPLATTTYTLTATGAGGTASATITVTVNPAPTLPPAVDGFAAAPATITQGESTTLSWTTTDATSVSIDNGIGTVAVDGSTAVSPLATTTYTLTATGAGGTASATITVTVNPAPTLPPAVDGFAAAPATITQGESTTLSWTTTDATSVSIDNGIGTVAVDGSTPVSPPATTTYTVTATGAGGTANRSVTVTVNPAAAETLSVSRTQFRSGKDEWRIQGTSSVAGSGNTITIFIGPTASGTVLGTAGVNAAGAWSFRERNSGVSPDATSVISVQSSNGALLEGISISIK